MTNFEKLAVSFALTQHEIERNETELRSGNLSVAQANNYLNRVGVLKEKMTSLKNEVFSQVENMQMELPSDISPEVNPVDESEEHY